MEPVGPLEAPAPHSLDVTLDLQQAARVLHVHPVALLKKAQQGIVPGCAKLGKRWVFILVDLLDYIRSQSPRRALQGDKLEQHSCHSSTEKTHRSCGSSSVTVDAQYAAALGLPTGPRLVSTRRTKSRN
jgi:hypothetical protein